MDYQALANQILGWLLLFFAGVLMLELTLIHLVAKAARMKNRSYTSFYWLSFVFRSGIMWLIVAALPFNEYDPRSPFTDTDPTSPEKPRYVNKHSLMPLIGRAENRLIGFSILAIIVSLIGVTVTIASPPTATAQTGSSNYDSSVSQTLSGCTLDLPSKKVKAGYIANGVNCIAWRWSTKSEDAKLNCDTYYPCVHAYVFAMSDCSTPTLEVRAVNASDTTLGRETIKASYLSAGETALMEVGVSSLSDWSSVYIDDENCG